MLRNTLINSFRYFVIRFFDFFRLRTQSSSFLNCFVNDHLHIDSNQVSVERKLILTVYICLLHLREGGVVMQGAEFVDLFIGAGSLRAKLIAGDIQNHKPLVMIVKVKLLNGRILRSKAAAGSRIHCQNHYFSGYTSMSYHV